MKKQKVSVLMRAGCSPAGMSPTSSMSEKERSSVFAPIASSTRAIALPESCCVKNGCEELLCEELLCEERGAHGTQREGLLDEEQPDMGCQPASRPAGSKAPTVEAAVAPASVLLDERRRRRRSWRFEQQVRPRRRNLEFTHGSCEV